MSISHIAPGLWLYVGIEHVESDVDSTELQTNLAVEDEVVEVILNLLRGQIQTVKKRYSDLVVEQNGGHRIWIQFLTVVMS